MWGEDIMRIIKIAISSLLCILCCLGKAEASVCEVLDIIGKRAVQSESETVLILHKGQIIGSFGYGQYKSIETRSITKSFVSLAVGLLIQEGKIASVDVPVYNFFPEWKQGWKQYVTIRHLLSNTSGIDIGDGCDFYQFPDILRLALSTDFGSFPGTRFLYNNKATNLLAGIVAKASNMSVQQYLRKSLFHPLGITSDSWLCDPAGNCFGMSHLSMNAVDLAKVGMLIAQDGCWHGIRLLAQEWVDTMMVPSQCFNPFYSFLWWLDYKSIQFHWDSDLLDQYRDAGMAPKFLQALESLDGYVVRFDSRVGYKNYMERAAAQLLPYFECQQDIYDFFAFIEEQGLPIARWEAGVVRGIQARGAFGQQLIVLPDYDLVAVRLSCQCKEGLDTFPDLEELLGLLGEELLNADFEVEFDCSINARPSMKCYDYRDDCEFRTTCPRCEETCLVPDLVPYYERPGQDLPYYNHEEETNSNAYNFSSTFEGAQMKGVSPPVQAPIPSPEPSASDVQMDHVLDEVNSQDDLDDIYDDLDDIYYEDLRKRAQEELSPAPQP